MKKNYVSPAILVMTVEAEALMAASPGGQNTIDVAFDDDNTFGGSFRAKGHSSVWDMDDEETD